MPCYHPLTGYRSRAVNPSGKRSIVFTLNQGYRDLPVTLPCGQCIGCRLEKSRQWAIRLTHEASLHTHNCFITLTYEDKYLPPDGSLQVEDFQKFMKRLRKKMGTGIKYFHCGEYGENFGRPHFHACLFNVRFKDQKPWKKINENTLYTSEILENLWPFGHSSVGSLTFESAAYVARYVTKKVTGKNALNHYTKFDWTGEIYEEKKPEYSTGSNGLGKNWISQYTTDVFPDDFIILRGKKLKPPRYYAAHLETYHPEAYAKLKGARARAGKKHSHNNTRDRLDVREEIHHLKAEQLKRSYENET